MLYTVDDVETGAMTRVGYTGYSGSSYTQCMVFDHNAGEENDELYWAMITGEGAVSIAYVDTRNGAALPLGTVDGGVQLTAMYSVPEAGIIPAREKVEVESISLKNGTSVFRMLEGSTKAAPISVLPCNAQDRSLTWNVKDKSIVEVDADNMIVAKQPGTTTVTVGRDGIEPVTFTVEVLESAGNLYGYVLTDLAFYDGQFWGTFKDYDLSAGEALALVEQLPDDVVTDNYSTPVVVDIVGNPYDGKLYAMIETSWGYYYLFEVNMSDGTLSLVMEIPEDMGLADEFVFTSEDGLLINDTMSDYVRTLNILLRMITGIIAE